MLLPTGFCLIGSFWPIFGCRSDGRSDSTETCRRFQNRYHRLRLSTLILAMRLRNSLSLTLRTPLILLAMASALGGTEEAASSLGTATVEGTVPLPGPPSPAVMAKRYEIVSKGGVLSTIPPVGVVWLEGEFPALPDPPIEQILQKGFLFEPALLTIRTGTEVKFPNEDDEYHNVFSYSPPKRFDLGRYLPEERPIPSQVFDKAGMVTLRCDIHEHMRAIILVIDSPHFTTTDTAGHFRMEGLPAGEYTLKAWVNSRETLDQTVVLEPGKTTRVDFAGD